MISFRQLTINDVDIFSELVKSRPQTFMGYSDDTFIDSIVSQLSSWLTDPFCFCIGLFNESEMTGGMVAIQSPHGPSWTWAYWVGKYGVVSAGLNEISQDREKSLQHVRDIDEFLFNEMENNRGLNRFFIVLQDKPSSTLGNSRSSDRFMFFMRKYSLKVARYEVYNDASVPADSMPKYEYQRQLLGNRTWPIDLGIKMCVLKG